MDVEKIAKICDALSKSVRIEVFRMLVENSKDGVCPCDIATKLDMPRNTLSFHLSTLVNADLCYFEKDGRNLIYKPNCKIISDLAGFLHKDCCDKNCKSFEVLNV